MIKTHVGDCLKVMQAMNTNSVDMVFTSPPYEGQRTYGIGFQLLGQAWVTWMAERVVEMCRVARGPVFVNASGPVRNAQYQPIVEWLVADLTRHCGLVCGPAPYCWTKNGIPGSGGKRYHRRDWEPIYVFAEPEKVKTFWTDNLATGVVPKYGPGGEMSHRMKDGRRVNGPNGRNKDGDIAYSVSYLPPKLANAGNVIRAKVGGNRLGSPLAHKNEAPFPESLVEPFIQCYCPPGGTVLDPFAGSGTVGAVAQRLGRHAVLIDVRDDQIEIAKERCNSVQTGLVSHERV